MISSDVERDGEVWPAVTRKVVRWKREARTRSRAGDVDGELAAWRKVLELDGEDPLARPVLARLLVRSGRFEEAVRHLWLLAEADPDDPENWRLLMKAAARTGDTDGLVAVLERIFAISGPDPTLLTKLVRQLTVQGRTAELVPHLLALADPAPPTTRLGLTFAGSPVGFVQLLTTPPWADLLSEVREACEQRQDEAGSHLAALLDDMTPACQALLMLKQRLLEGADGEAAVASASPVVGMMEALAQVDLTTKLGRLRGLVRDQIWVELSIMLMDHDAWLAEIIVLERWLGHGAAPPWARRRLARLSARLGRPGKAPRTTGRAEAPVEEHPSTPRPATDPLSALLPRHVFVLPHAPKTGGSSIKSGLRRILGDTLTGSSIRAVGSSLALMPPETRRRLGLVSGHFSLDQAEDELVPLLALEPLLLAVVRDPVARAKSIYRYIGRRAFTPELRNRQLRARFDPDVNVMMRRWLDAPSDWGGWRHDQCRTICGEPDADAAIRALETRYLAAVTTTSLNALVTTTAKALARAAPPALHRKQTSSQELELEPALEAKLRDSHHQDQRLFEWVQANQERLLERCEARLRKLRPRPDPPGARRPPK